MKTTENKIKNQEVSSLLEFVSNNAIDRDNFAMEAMKMFLHKELKFGYPENYEFVDIAEKAYKMADAMCKARGR